MMAPAKGMKSPICSILIRAKRMQQREKGIAVVGLVLAGGAESVGLWRINRRSRAAATMAHIHNNSKEKT